MNFCSIAAVNGYSTKHRRYERKHPTNCSCGRLTVLPRDRRLGGTEFGYEAWNPDKNHSRNYSHLGWPLLLYHASLRPPMARRTLRDWCSRRITRPMDCALKIPEATKMRSSLTSVGSRHSEVTRSACACKLRHRDLPELAFDYPVSHFFPVSPRSYMPQGPKSSPRLPDTHGRGAVVFRLWARVGSG